MTLEELNGKYASLCTQHGDLSAKIAQLVAQRKDIMERIRGVSKLASELPPPARAAESKAETASN